MKLQDYLLLIALSILAVHWFWFKQPAPVGDEIKAGQSFKVSTADQMLKPINSEVDFVSMPTAKPAETLEIMMPHANYLMSSAAASVEKLQFKRFINHKEELLTTIHATQAYEKSKHAFLVALNEMTPYYYTLVDKKHTNDVTTLVYSSQTPEAVVTKQYTITPDYKIDLKITIQPKKATGVQARLFFPAPFLDELEPSQGTMGIVYDERNSLKKNKVSELEHSLWAHPTLFGAENRYFVHALVTDPQHFTQRAYYKLDGSQHLTAILEGPVITEPTTWDLTFYCGPKEHAALAAVDPRLEGTLEYGIFAPLSKFLLALLTLLYSYVHNYGWAIIFLTILLKLILVPFSLFGAKKDNKGDLGKKLQHLEQKYKHDRDALARERLELLTKHGSFKDLKSAAGCLPMILQLLVPLALNKVLTSSIELYHAPFIPGWINDLSAKDPYYVLPALFVLAILMQPSTIKDPRQRLAMVIFALIAAAFFANFSAGLMLFICTWAIAGVAQTALQNRIS